MPKFSGFLFWCLACEDLDLKACDQKILVKYKELVKHLKLIRMTNDKHIILEKIRVGGSRIQEHYSSGIIDALMAPIL